MSNVQFSETQKAAIVSLLIEMINADGSVDPSECNEFDCICTEFAIGEDTYSLGRSLNSIVALDIMKRMSDVQKIVTAQLLTRVIDADARDDDNEIRLFNIICNHTGVDVIMSVKDADNPDGTKTGK